jgi:hypothetical protein
MTGWETALDVELHFLQEGLRRASGSETGRELVARKHESP